MKVRGRLQFFLRNFWKGLAWLAAIIVAYILFDRYLEVDYQEWIQPLYDQPLIVYIVFLVSEIVIGIIPPEIFMIWSSKGHVDETHFYILSILLLSSISYSAGLIGYWIGSWFHRTSLYKRIEAKFFGKYVRFLRRFGSFIVFVAALTPLPFSGICMLVGAAQLNFKKFVLVALFRFVRFAAYGYIIWLTV